MCVERSEMKGKRMVEGVKGGIRRKEEGISNERGHPGL